MDKSDPDPVPESLTRRMLLRAGGALGIAAAGAAVTGEASAMSATADRPDEPGAFGRPPTADVLRRQLRRHGNAGSSTDVSSGKASGPEATSAGGVRLQPSSAAVDDTPLSRRTSPEEPWKVEG